MPPSSPTQKHLVRVAILIPSGSHLLRFSGVHDVQHLERVCYAAPTPNTLFKSAFESGPGPFGQLV